MDMATSIFSYPPGLEEAEEVARLASIPFEPGRQGFTIQSLAHTLGVEPSEVERLLRQIRLHRMVGTSAPRRRFADRSAVVSAGLALVLVAGSMGAWRLCPGKKPQFPIEKIVARVHRPATDPFVVPPRPARIGVDPELRFPPATRLRLNALRQNSMRHVRETLDQAENGTSLDYARIDAEMARLRAEQDALTTQIRAS